MGKQVVLARDIVDSLDISHLWLFSHGLKDNREMLVAIYEGNTTLDQLSLDPSILNEDIAAQIFLGNLMVKGAIHNEHTDQGADALIVLGNLWAKNIVVGGQEVFVRGNLEVSEILCGSHNNGEMTVLGDVSAKLLIADDYRFWIGGRLNAPVLNIHSPGVALMKSDDKDSMKYLDGYVAASAALVDEVNQDNGGDDMNFSFAALHEVISEGHSALRPEFIRNPTDLSKLREANRLFRAGDEAYTNDDYQRAIELLQAAMDAGYAAMPVRYRIASAIYELHYNDTKAQQAALPHLTACIDNHYQETDCRIKRASLFLASEKPDHNAAWADCQWVSENSTDTEECAEALDLMGYSLYRRTRYAAAIPYLEKSIEKDPDNANPYGNLARTMWRVGRHSDAIPYADKALELNPDWNYLYFVRGSCYRDMDKMEEAEDDLIHYINKVPASVKAWRMLVLVFSKQGKRELARRAAERAQALDPESSATQIALAK